ncbi:HD domain-containing protein [Propionispora vibrioides]|uniref:HD/PDEase domain-containing protein n=1 Tax=Propionispora vibrioides TaxID=112903 RepID=A0A1H8Y4H9_9FIRM|nr:HD domain-containing protein [Propionispora vibrioides]SEP46986.1 hypothetical protein SAMN04490178_14211 [Propionispora vibrioides]
MDSKYKVIKDSVHGYIEIPEVIIDHIIDTPHFQRLNRIEQTSMRVLYPSARHDRFIHSIGTYYLGCKAFRYFKININNEFPELDISPDQWDKWQISFELACLLHDVGHSPFSHTLEHLFQSKKHNIDNERTETYIDFRLKSKMSESLKDKFKEQFEDYCKTFETDYRGCSPAPHERVSSIVVLECFQSIISELGADIELIVRSIIGCVYKNPQDHYGIKNCLIRMLNSNLIDVDKLDYIARDTMLTGFENITIDTERLLRSMTAYKVRTDYYPAYNKNALSVIQNVITANNAQQAWIVNHHVVIYNAHLVKVSINKLAKIMHDNPQKWLEDLFSVDSIIGKVKLEGKINTEINMLCDDDLWHLLKRYMEDIPEVQEMLDRRKRKTALWKSLAEYTTLFDMEERQGEYSFNIYSSYFSNACSSATNFSGYLNVSKEDEPNYAADTNLDYDTCSSLIDEFCKKYQYDSKQFICLKGGETYKNNAAIARDSIMIKFGNREKNYKDVMKYYNQTSNASTMGAGSSSYFFLYYNASDKPINKDEFVDFIKICPEFRANNT